MAIELEIRDGNPWWMSPDLWVVPGSDPTGPPGTPVAGDMAYLWAQVRNIGESRVENVTVRFYWANPAVGVDRTTANFVGSANVTLDGGQVSDVLCLVRRQVVLVTMGTSVSWPKPFIPLFLAGGARLQRANRSPCCPAQPQRAQAHGGPGPLSSRSRSITRPAVRARSA